MTEAEWLRIPSNGTDSPSGSVEETVLDAVPVVNLSDEMKKLWASMDICCCEIEKFFSENEKEGNNA